MIVMTGMTVRINCPQFQAIAPHIQFNVVSAQMLHEAQSSPEKYGHLVVRVAGYSAYFTELDRELQDEIIKRTEFAGMD